VSGTAENSRRWHQPALRGSIDGRPIQTQQMTPRSQHASLTNSALELGPRGSRLAVANADPGGPLQPATLRVIGAVPLWWERRAAAVGLRGRWTDVFAALNTEAPVDASSLGDPKVAELQSEALGQAYVDSLGGALRARHGRHYTPSGLGGPSGCPAERPGHSLALCGIPPAAREPFSCRCCASICVPSPLRIPA